MELSEYLLLTRTEPPLIRFFSELVLSVLLETFVFSPGSQEIYWNMGGLQSPVVKGSTDITPRLPMNVAFVKDRPLA